MNKLFMVCLNLHEQTLHGLLKTAYSQSKGVNDKLLNLAVGSLRLINELPCVASKFLNELFTLKSIELI